MSGQIEAYICENLTGIAKETALEFISFLRDSRTFQNADIDFEIKKIGRISEIL